MSHPWPLGLFINNVAQRGVEVFLLALRKGIKGHAKGIQEYIDKNIKRAQIKQFKR